MQKDLKIVGQLKNNAGYRVYDRGGCCPTILSSVYKRGVFIVDDIGIRRLTPKECIRLMGFDDEDYEKMREVNSESQIYKQAGNGIVVPVLEAIFKQMIGEEE